MNSGYNNQSQEPFGSTAWGTPVAAASEETRFNFIRKTYVLFMAGILTAVVSGAICLTVEPVLAIALGILRMPILAFGLIIGGSIAAQALARKEGVNYLALFGFTALIGMIFAPIIAIYAPSVIGQAAFLTCVIFGSLTAYVFVTRKDFSFMGGMLFIGMVGMVLAGAANLFFFKSSGMSYWISWFVLFLSSGFVLYQTSNLIHEYRENEYCAAALGLFISFFNIFMSLLNILGGNRD